MMRSLRAVAVQMVSSTDPETNIAMIKRLVHEAVEQGVDWVLLPEYWPPMGKNDTDKLAFAKPLDDGRVGETYDTRFQTALSETARGCDVVLFGGMVPLQSSGAGKVMNTVLVYDRDGNRIGFYRKMHLFGFSGLGERYAEVDMILAGSDVPKLSVDDVPLMAGICYDLRFPEFFRAQQPFDVLLLPAASTYTVDKTRWELLLRARAAKNQCYVIASAQGGLYESGRRTFGYSMIIDPWGDVLATLSEGEGMICADLDTMYLQSVCTRLSALKHRLL